MKLKKAGLKAFLDEKVELYNNTSFIETDPISIPHRFSQKEDIEISGFLAATIAWGNRVSILRSADRMMSIMGNTPYDFVINHRDSDLKGIEGCMHRTFNAEDFIYFIEALKYIYLEKGGMETIFACYRTDDSLQPAIHEFGKIFFGLPHNARTRRHLSDPRKGSAAKRLNMFLRWMVRHDRKGVDFGLWRNIGMNRLKIPLDVHTGKVARQLGLLKRKQNDWQAVCELTDRLRTFDPDDPVKYDYALFGLGVFEKPVKVNPA
ncbi:MAG: TIGR02757 family protein [Bacteroidales bacterium]|nr:TIGR02757 family protein [Bacteroidales bacterium]